MLSEKQIGVRNGAIIAVVITLTLMPASIFYQPDLLMPKMSDSNGTLSNVKWFVLIIAPLLINVVLLAQHRFFSADDIDGSGLTNATDKARLLQSMLQNSLEQSVLAISSHLVWLLLMPPETASATAAAAIMFFVGRILFMRGYQYGAPSRALGFGLTFYPTVFLFICELVWFIRSFVV